MVSKILEISFTAIVLFLILSNGDKFAQVMSSISGAYVQGVRTLQGR